MRSAVLTVALVASSLSFAMGGKLPPANDGSGREQCAYYDAGSTEEHSPHRSLQECRRQHDNCEMMCFVYEAKCIVEGIRTELVQLPDGKVDRRQSVRTYSAQHRDRFRAEDESLRSCERDFPRNESCHIRSCEDVANRTH